MKTIIFTCFIFLSAVVTKAQNPDLILINGKIFTSDTSRLYVEAIAIKSGRIVAAGKTVHIKKLADDNCKILDLEGMLVVPGFNDAHNHLPDGLKSTKLTLTGMDPSWQTVIDSLKVLVKKVPEGEWIEGTIGLSIANSPEANRFILDKIAPKHPVRLLSWWGHVGLFNTAGMNKMGIATTQKDPKGGFYERMPDHKTLTGKAFEKNAYNPNTSYQKMVKMRDDQALINELRGITQELLKNGITSYQNMCTGATADDYIKLWKQAGLPFRLRLIRWADINEDESLSIPSKELPKHSPEMPLLTVSGTKWLLEGTPLEQGANEVDAYPNTADWHGRMNYTIPEIEAMCRDAINRKDQIHFHLGGSKSIGEVLDLMSSMNVDWKAMRPRFEHGDEIDYSADYLEKAKSLGVIIVQNPTHFAPLAGMPLSLRAKHGGAMKSLLSKGIPVAIGSDGPFNPYLNIMMAITHPSRPDEALSREEAVIAYTSSAAYAEFEEKNKGTLTVGKVADLAVLSQNIFTADIPLLMQTQSILTMVNGVVVYDAGVLKIK